jgi:hypothetical protein
MRGEGFILEQVADTPDLEEGVSLTPCMIEME